MLVTLDLTERQAHRVLAQAVRTRAKFEIEPRPDAHSALLWGTLAGNDKGTLQVDLHDVGANVSLAALIGAMCDVRMILSGQLCLFSTYVREVSDRTVPQRVVLAVPETIQVANRRRFARHAPVDPVPVRFFVPAAQPPFVAIMSNIGPHGVACRVISTDIDDVLFIGDEVRVEFVLPWGEDVYSLPAIACSKTRCREEGHVIIGFEFVAAGHEAVLERLRNALQDEAARLTESEGQP